MPESQWRWVCGSALSLALLIVWVLRTSPEEGISTSPIRWVLCLTVPVLLTWRALRKGSLSLSGASAAVVVGVLLSLASACLSLSLVAFFVTSSALTKWKAREKKKVEDGYKEGGQRDWVQVLCNGGVASVCALLYLREVGMRELPLRAPVGVLDTPTIYCLAAVASIACCCGDTWASEVGSVIGGTPLLITSWRRTPVGTNGGVSVVGVVCSVAGGTVVGGAYFLSLGALWGEGLSEVGLPSQLFVVPVGAAGGLLGSLVDSLLGATLQYSGYSEKLGKVVNCPGPGVVHISGWDVLNNHTVNLLSSLITALVIPLVCGWLGIIP